MTRRCGGGGCGGELFIWHSRRLGRQFPNSSSLRVQGRIGSQLSQKKKGRLIFLEIERSPGAPTTVFFLGFRCSYDEQISYCIVVTTRRHLSTEAAISNNDNRPEA